MRAVDPNLPYLRHIAEALGDLREQVVFVGGAVAGLLVTDPLRSLPQRWPRHPMNCVRRWLMPSADSSRTRTLQTCCRACLQNQTGLAWSRDD